MFFLLRFFFCSIFRVIFAILIFTDCHQERQELKYSTYLFIDYQFTTYFFWIVYNIAIAQRFSFPPIIVSSEMPTKHLNRCTIYFNQIDIYFRCWRIRFSMVFDIFYWQIDIAVCGNWTLRLKRSTYYLQIMRDTYRNPQPLVNRQAPHFNVIDRLWLAAAEPHFKFLLW